MKLALYFCTAWWAFSNVGGMLHVGQCWIIWKLCYQNQVSQAEISNYIPPFTVGCNYLPLPEIPASENNVLIYRLIRCILMTGSELIIMIDAFTMYIDYGKLTEFVWCRRWHFLLLFSEIEHNILIPKFRFVMKPYAAQIKVLFVLIRVFNNRGISDICIVLFQLQYISLFVSQSTCLNGVITSSI